MRNTNKRLTNCISLYQEARWRSALSEGCVFFFCTGILLGDGTRPGRIRDFYFKEALAAPADATFVHRAGLVPDQRRFSLERLRRYLNDSLLDLNYLNIFLNGNAVDLDAARVYKTVQRRKIAFVGRSTTSPTTGPIWCSSRSVSAMRRGDCHA